MKEAFLKRMQEYQMSLGALAQMLREHGLLQKAPEEIFTKTVKHLVYNSKEPGRDHFVERVERQNGVHTIEAAAELGFGTREYEIINID